ncbi:nitrate- and nitrite sensing domain-containing protein [Amycolatopsis sp. H20-H5]|uniref:nitrate- and nitrite sensing domain-containing protein n=1 Tax=Amycolatopsis sp. H20-H5 TaxID=3046309 RepID=UPI002DB85039|nr:nitrate- and nitrite sensing domain-containing protein [Amycolatopsis sp. H20-H5]MEC3977973.1 nitrate- and nitrite sensing domain-containing protein [Amycolatopsis sp. H20-H5]
MDLKHLRTLRGRVLFIASVPSAALGLIALVIAGFLLQQAIQTRDSATEAAVTTVGVTRGIHELQQDRNRALQAPGTQAAGYAFFTARIDADVASLRDLARSAPDADAGYEQMTAVELLAAAEGMYRGDSLAAAGLDEQSRPEFAGTVSVYRTALAVVSTKLTQSGREQYDSLVRSEDWSRLGSVENALADARPLPVSYAVWRASATAVAGRLDELYTQQDTYATRLSIDGGRRTLSGALAATTAILLFAGLIAVVVLRLARWLPVPVVPPPAPAKPAARHRRPEVRVPRPRSSGTSLEIPDPRLLQAVLDGIRKL